MRGLTLATFRLVEKTPLLNKMLVIFVNTGLRADALFKHLCWYWIYHTCSTRTLNYYLAHMFLCNGLESIENKIYGFIRVSNRKLWFIV